MINRTRTLFILAVAILAASTAPASSDREFPVASLGDIWFQVDQAAFRSLQGTLEREFYFRLSNNQVVFREGGEMDPLEGRVFIRLEFRDENEETVGEASRDFTFFVPDAAQATSSEHAQVLLMREQVDPRTVFVKVELEDLNARKRGLLYMVTGKRRNGSAEARLQPPASESKAFGVSDLQFAWDIHPADPASDFEKNGFNVVPNPARTFGLLQTSVHAYFEVYDPRSADAPQLYIIDHRVLAPDSTVMHSQSDTVTAPGGAWARTLQFNVDGYRHGDFLLDTSVRHFASGDVAHSSRQFGVVWGAASLQSEEDVLNQAKVLFAEEEYNRFTDMSLADREVYLEEFWAQHNPTPGSQVNELRARFLKRVAVANDNFGAFGRKGMLTDQGRIFIRFGAPDEVVRELMPTQGSQLDQFIADTGVLEDPRAERLVTADAVDTRPYEVWMYTRQGAPLFPEREFSTSITGLEFVFIDETGAGHWILRYQSDFVNY